MKGFPLLGIKKAIDSTKLGMWNYTIDTDILIWNSYMFYLFDKDHNSDDSNIVKYNDFLSKIHPDEREFINKKVIDACINKKPYNVNYRVVWRDSSIHYYQAIAENYENENNTYSLIGTVLDITDFYNQKEKEKERLVLKSKLDLETKHNKELHIIMRSVAHEIRNPLQGILGSATMIDTMLNDIVTDDKNMLNGLNVMKECMDDLMECIYYQLNVLNDLIDYNLLENNEINTNVKTDYCNLKEILISIVKMFSMNAKNKNLNLSFELDESLHNFISDSKKIKRIIINLVSNSIKFTENGYILIKAVNLVKDNKNICKISVEDSGIGIPEYQRENIFNNIGQSTTQNEIISGSGLGLSICHKLVSNLNGSIYIDPINTENKGTIISFEFELKWIFNIPEENILFGSSNDEILNNSVPVSWSNNIIISDNIISNKEILLSEDILKNRSILFADDNKINQKVIKKMLENYVKKIIIVSNGKEAIEEFNKNNYDIIILDIHMPIMGGKEAATIIRETNVLTPIIFLTGEALTSELSKFKNSFILLKPCAKADLIRTCSGCKIK
jgi:signal transduction histidine kinase/CheY-like chemotaxis protein